MTASQSLPQSEHFDLQQLADGVYAAFAVTRGAVGNAGFVDLGGATLIFDTFMTPQAAEDLRDAALALTGGPIRYAVNSHWHADHVLGNPVLPEETVFISTGITRDWMVERIPGRIQAFLDTRSQMEEALVRLRGQLADADEAHRPAIQAEIRTNEIGLEALPRLSLRLPALTFVDRLDLYGTDRRVSLLTYGGGHTKSDAILHLPDDGIVFVADLLFAGSHPWIGDGNPGDWPGILDRVDQLEAATVVPGHGPLSTPAAFDVMRAYMPAVLAVVDALVAAHAAPADLESVEVPAQFADLEGQQRFANNVRALFEQATSAT